MFLLVFVSIVGLKKIGIPATFILVFFLYILFWFLVSQWWFWLLLGVILVGFLYYVFARKTV